MSGAGKDLRRFASELCRDGWRERPSHGGHRVFISPDGERLVLSVTPRSGASVVAARADLRRLVRRREEAARDPT